MLFQSLAPQHNLKSALRHLFLAGKSTSTRSLKEVLRQRYGGHTVELYSRGRAALAEAIRVAAAGKDGSVAITGYTCFSVEQAVLAAGLKPVYLDIDPKTIHFGGKELKQSLKNNKDIIVVVVQNNLGVPADMASIEEVAKASGIMIVEDLAHSAGTGYKDGREAGTVGDVAMLSFGKGKSIDTVNGGAVIVRNTTLGIEPTKPSRKVNLKDYLRDRIYPILGVIIRWLFRIKLGRYALALVYKLKLMVKSADGEVEVDKKLPSWQARLALAQLINLDDEVSRRQSLTKTILESLNVNFIEASKDKNASLIRVPFVVNDRASLLARLKSAGLFVEDVWYDSPLSPIRYHGRSMIDMESLPVSDRLTGSVVNLPTHSNFKIKDIKRAAKIINEAEK